jgi:site-specific recombinase XerD
MNTTSTAHFDRQYQTHLKHLRLKGLQPKTIDAYARAIRRIGRYFDYRIDDLSEPQLTDYFSDLIKTHSWSAVKLDLYGLKFYYTHVLHKPWGAPGLIKSPKVQRLPDIVTIDEAQRLFAATRTLSYRVFYFTLYSLGLRLGEGLRLRVSDIDAERQRVHIRDAKGNKDRLVPLPLATLAILRRFWQVQPPRAAVPQSPWQPAGGVPRPHPARPGRRADDATPGRACVRAKKRSPRTA